MGECFVDAYSETAVNVGGGGCLLARKRLLARKLQGGAGAGHKAGVGSLINLGNYIQYLQKI